ncbi:hypothetical protein [Afifella sp. YEN Y35]|uniref:hypothetical protein n=1 Tax=Afifella sp. YEN Y35 TaxID=3388337 RepID=UPI0039DF73B8
MFLPRRHYLALAGVETHQFKALQRRNQVPLLGAAISDLRKPSEEEAVAFHARVEERGYVPADAILLAIAEHMVTQNSFSRAAAKRITQSFWNVLPGAVRRAEAGEDIWYAVGSWDFGDEKQADEDGSRAHWTWVEVGAFDELVDEIREEQRRTEAEGGKVDNLALFNLSIIVRRAHQAGRELGLSIGSFFPTISAEGCGYPPVGC